MYVTSVTALEPILAPYLSEPPFQLQPTQLGFISAVNTLCFVVLVGLASYVVAWIGPLLQAGSSSPNRRLNPDPQSR